MLSNYFQVVKQKWIHFLQGGKNWWKAEQNHKLNSAFICNTSQQTASGFQSDWITQVLSKLNIYIKKYQSLAVLMNNLLDPSVNNQVKNNLARQLDGYAFNSEISVIHQ